MGIENPDSSPLIDEEWINTPAVHETESEDEFLHRLLRILNDRESRSVMNVVACAELIRDRLDPEYARYGRRSLVDPPWAKSAREEDGGL